MKFIILFFNITPLYAAIEKGNIQIVKLLLEHPKIDVNTKYLIILTKYI